MLRKNLFFSYLSHGYFDDLIQSGFWVIPNPKIRFASLCKPIDDAIIVPVSFGSLDPDAVERKGKNHDNLNILCTKKAF